MKENTTVWQSSPSRWLLFSRFFICLLLIPVVLLAALSQLNVVISSEAKLLLQTQVFLYNHSLACYGIYAFSALMYLKLIMDYLKLRFENYEVTPKKLLFSTGILNRDIDETLLFRIIDISVELPLLLRILNRGHLVIFSNDPSLEASGIKPSFQTPDGRKGVYLAAIKDPVKVKELLSKHVDRERSKHSTRSTEIL